MNLFARFFCAIHFFIYLCGMENRNKEGYVIKDKEIKTINKLVKNIVIETNGRKDGWNDHRGMLLGAKIKIKSVRKYKNRWSWKEVTKFCYEVDIEVDITKSNYMDYSGANYAAKYDTGRGVRRTNDYYRSSYDKYVEDELKYFGIDTRGYGSNMIVSKIKYTYQ